ncbi:MAG: PTS sugar transporter subunit IIA [Anaerolineaceae bacterium]|jgi:PTS system mannose-specific IIA component
MDLRSSKKCQTPNLPGIVLLSHGPMAFGMMESAEMITGKLDNFVAISLEPGDTPESFRDAYEKVLMDYPKGSIVLVDLFGGTPSNQIMQTVFRENCNVFAIAGMNLGMLIEASVLRTSCSGQALLDKLEIIGKESVINLTDKVREIKENLEPGV